MLRKPSRANSCNSGRRDVRRLVVAAERVGQAGIRMRGGQAGCDSRELGDVRPHLTGAERAVDADDQRIRVLDRRPETVDRLPTERAAGEIDDRHADPERELRGDRARGDQRRLRVQRVEDRLDQQQVDAAVGEPANLLGVGLDDLVEGVRPVAGIVHARAQRERDVQRAHRAGNEPIGPGGSPRDACAGDVQVVDRILEPVVGLADRRRRERVGRGDVGAGGEVRVVHRTNDLRLRQVQQVGIVEQVARMIREALAPEIGLLEPAVLQQDAPGAVEHEDALLGEASDLVGDVAVGHELFRRLVTRSPSCFSKLSGTWILANGVRHQSVGPEPQERPATASWFSAWRRRCSICQRSAVESPRSIASSSAWAASSCCRARASSIALASTASSTSAIARSCKHLEEARPGCELEHFAVADVHARRARLQSRDQGRMPRQHADLARRAGHDDHLGVPLVRRPVGRHDGDGELAAIGHPLRRPRRPSASPVRPHPRSGRPCRTPALAGRRAGRRGSPGSRGSCPRA